MGRIKVMLAKHNMRKQSISLIKDKNYHDYESSSSSGVEIRSSNNGCRSPTVKFSMERVQWTSIPFNYFNVEAPHQVVENE